MNKGFLSYIRELFINKAEIDNEDFNTFILHKNYEKFMLLIIFAVIISTIMLLLSEFSGDDKRIIISDSVLLMFSIVWLLPMFLMRKGKISDWLFFVPVCVLLAYVNYLLGNFSYRGEFFSTYTTSVFIIAVLYTTSWQKMLLLFAGSLFYLYFFTPYIHGGPLSYTSVNVLTVFNILFAAWFVSRVMYLSVKKEYENKARIKKALLDLEKENKKNVRIVDELQDLKIELEDKIKQRTDELQKEKSKVEMSDKSKSIFLSNMSHELRTPLSGIMGTLEMLKAENVSKAERESLLKMANESSQQLYKIVDDILEISSLRSGKYEILVEKFDPVDHFLSITDHFRKKAEEKGLEFKVRMNGQKKHLYVVSDSKRIKLILDNIIGNAVKFTDKGFVACSMSLLSEEDRDFLQFSIEDTGMGISSSGKENLFEFFSNDSKEFSDDTISLGLGLRLTREYIQKLEGTLLLESRKHNGTLFEIKIPVEFKIETIPEDTGSDDYIIGDINRILIAEDNKINRFLLKKILEEKHYQVIEAENGEKAVEEFIKYDIDAVLMDIQMPVMDGYMALSGIRKIKRKKYVPVIAITGYASTDDKNDILNSGFDAYLPKPFDKNNLLYLLEDLKHRGGKHGD